MPRFVVLEHDHPFVHWDLMLEAGGKLRTWRLAAVPAPGASMAAEPLGDHRLAYLDYQGPVGGGRGSVVRWDDGDYELVQGADLEGERLLIQLRGRRIEGRVQLERVDPHTWTARFDPAD